MKRKKTILCFVDYYLPGFRSGGPVRTVANFADHLGDEFNIRIICCDRDLQDTKSYPGIKINCWNTVGKAKVFYISEKKNKFLTIAKLLRETQHDVLYLNSVFSFNYAIIPLLVRLLGFAPKISCVIGPRGEFSKNALSFRKYKKKLFMFIAKYFNLYANLHWQASSDYELIDIRREFGQVAKKVIVARDLTPNTLISEEETYKRQDGLFRIIFLSRIAPMKNLDFLLKVLARVPFPLEINIFGPKQDIQYWNYCLELIKKLPDYIKVTIGEEVPHERVLYMFSQNDLFVFPTQGEALGHIILECLSAGTPVLVSDQTSWQPDDLGGLEALPLNEDIWVKKIETWASLPNNKFIEYRKAAKNYAKIIHINNLKSLNENKKLFYDVVELNKY
jgi:glycosyltransferase involved in cell wall biosynthesis